MLFILWIPQSSQIEKCKHFLFIRTNLYEARKTSTVTAQQHMSSTILWLIMMSSITRKWRKCIRPSCQNLYNNRRIMFSGAVRLTKDRILRHLQQAWHEFFFMTKICNYKTCHLVVTWISMFRLKNLILYLQLWLAVCRPNVVMAILLWVNTWIATDEESEDSSVIEISNIMPLSK